jgi:hypothetical protein
VRVDILLTCGKHLQDCIFISVGQRVGPIKIALSNHFLSSLECEQSCTCICVHHVNILLQELTRMNTEVACVCLSTLIEDLEHVHQSQWLDVISQSMSKLNSSIPLHEQLFSYISHTSTNKDINI